MDKDLAINLGVLAGIIVVYFMVRSWKRYDQEFLKLYYEIINSDKYKVKGRN
jgi:hypothetical protein